MAFNVELGKPVATGLFVRGCLACGRQSTIFDTKKQEEKEGQIYTP